MALTNAQNHAEYDMLIMGWPQQTDMYADQLLVSLNRVPLSRFPVLILSEDGDPAKLDWITNRSYTSLLSWNDYTESPDTIESIASSSVQEYDPLGDTSSIHLLLVDDSPTVRFNYGELLRTQGIQVSVAANVEEAYDLATSTAFDVVICDYFMPDANGDELIRKLKENPDTADIEVAILTSTYSDQIIRSCLNAGAIECMFKNEAEELLLARINSIIRSIFDRRRIDNERARLERILSSVGDGVFGVNNKGIIEFINPAGLRLLGYEQKAGLVGEPASECIHSKLKDGTKTDASNCELIRAYETGKRLDGLQIPFWKNKGKKSIVVECTAYPMQIDGHKTGTVVAFRDISDRMEEEERLHWAVAHDPLTKLKNRVEFERILEKEILSLRDSTRLSALLFIDLDRFKYINDTAGHLAGDEVLIEVGERLQSQLGESDVLARISGDEFAIILRDVDSDPDLLIESCDRFRAVVECAKFYFDGTGYSTTLTAGVRLLDQEVHSVSDAMSEADLACHAAKSSGRNQTHIFDAHRDKSSGDSMELSWSTKMRDALLWNRYRLHFQPIVPLKYACSIPPGKGLNQLNETDYWQNDQPKRFEALIRMRDTDAKLILPGAFLPTAERFEMISNIDKWVIDSAFHQIAENPIKNLEMFINLSVQTLLDGDIVQYIDQKIQQYNIHPQGIVFEITETSAVNNIDEANAQIERIKALGPRFALDDFGNGFSSFYHLKHLNADIIKIDGVFTRNLVQDSVDRSVILAINEIAHSLGKQTIVEQVDCPEIIEILKDSNIDFLQGFYLSEPLESLSQLSKVTVGSNQSSLRSHAAAK